VGQTADRRWDRLLPHLQAGERRDFYRQSSSDSDSRLSFTGQSKVRVLFGVLFSRQILVEPTVADSLKVAEFPVFFEKMNLWRRAVMAAQWTSDVSSRGCRSEAKADSESQLSFTGQSKFVFLFGDLSQPPVKTPTHK